MPSTRPLAALCLTAALSACGGEVIDAGRFALDGDWAGTTDSLEVFLSLDQTDRDVSGDGELRGPRDTLSVDVLGDWEFPSVTLVLTAPEFAASRFDAQQPNDSTLTGTLTGSGFQSRTLTLRRVRR